MQTAITTESTSLLFPLDEFYRREQRELPGVELADAHEIPEPYRRLLVHEDDMTPTLEAFHEGRATLKLLTRREEDGRLWRLVVLVRERDGKPLEFGAIVIHLEHFAPEAREVVLGCRRPLGTILADYAIAHTSHPRAFLRIQPDRVICSVLNLVRPATLFGRRNLLTTPAGDTLAEIVEILPPERP